MKLSDLIKFEHLTLPPRSWEEFVRDVTIYAPARWASLTKQGRRELVPPLFHLHFEDGAETIVRTNKQFAPILRKAAHVLGTADAIAILFEGWVSSYERHEMDEHGTGPFDTPSATRKAGVAMPSQRPDRREVLWLVVQVRNGEDRWAAWDILTPSGKPGRKRVLRRFASPAGNETPEHVSWPTFERMIPREGD